MKKHITEYDNGAGRRVVVVMDEELEGVQPYFRVRAAGRERVAWTLGEAEHMAAHYMATGELPEPNGKGGAA